MQSQSLFEVDDTSQVGHTRRAALELARILSFGDEQGGKVALAATECASNILKHAGRGQLMLRPLQCENIGGVEIIALDKGPGIADVTAALRDGHSTRGTMGGGLGALSRLSDTFDIYTQPGKGTAVRLALWARKLPDTWQPIEFGGVCVPKHGEPVSGDDWSVVLERDQAVVLVADGLGHGISAHEAARAATETLAQHLHQSPERILDLTHGALARTRGAAVAVARLVSSSERGSFAAVGNIVARIEGGPANRHLISHNGTVGHTMRKLQEFAFPWPAQALLVMHSDGLGTHWDFSAYPGLTTKHPALIAAVLYRDYDRGRDDCSVVVIRNRGNVARSP
jgi:anti-sigma regulatory factor (Ser/Thr protein kinase)